MPLNSDGDAQHFDKYKMLFRLQIAVALGCVFIILYALQFLGHGQIGIGIALRIASVGILAAGAALFLGFLLGFIFCIPRTAKPTGAAAASSSSDPKDAADSSPHSTAVAFSAVETNTNLVDISDWLTKILVGVGLVELNKIPSALSGLADFLAPGLRECDSITCVGSSKSFAIGIVIFFFGAGFLIGYLWTRLYFQRALSELADLAQRVDKSWLDATNSEYLLDEGRLDDAIRAVDEAIRISPTNARALFAKGRILKRFAQRDGKPGDKALLKEALDNVSKAAALLPNKAGPLYNMACYQALLGVDKAEVIRNLKRAIQLNPKMGEIASNDDDFISLRDDIDFKGLTGTPPENA
jgi:hypothetical protein